MATSLSQTQWSSLLSSGNRIFIGSNAAVPNALITSLINDAPNIVDIEATHIVTIGECEWAKHKYSDKFKINTFFIYGKNVREAVEQGRADYTPCFLSEVSDLFKDDVLPLDAALVMVSEPDELGYCSLGVSVDVVLSAAKAAKHIIAQINPLMPKTCGHSFIHIDEISAYITQEQALPEVNIADTSKISDRIAQYVSLLVDNGATIQLGIGKIPEAVTRYLNHHKDLGVHSEMISDGIMHLMREGVINNRRKTFHPGKTVTSFCLGTQQIYDFIDGNPQVEFYPSSYVNKPANIAKNNNMVSINSAIEVDLSGQVVADSIGYHFYSGIGGQVDFVSGSAQSKGGKSIIAIPSTAKNGKISRIVATLSKGAGVVTSRGNVQFVVTEFGIASLKGKSIRERALELIRVAHPKFRDKLLDDIRQQFWVPNYQTQSPTDVLEFGDMQLKTIQLDDEEYVLRPLNPADERRLQEFFYSHTKETIMMRYNYNPGAMTREKSCDLVSVDQSRDLALTIVKQEGSKIRIEAVGRYYYYPSQNSCEVAFVTRESNQGKGMAKLLLSTMMDVAKKRQLDTMFAIVKRSNKAMINVFQQYQFISNQGEDLSEVELSLKLK